MSLKSRLNRLERCLRQRGKPLSFWYLWFKRVSLPPTFAPDRDLDRRHLRIWRTLVTLPCWLQEQGFALATEALEAGVRPPPFLDDVLKEQAAIGYYHEIYDHVFACELIPNELWSQLTTLEEGWGGIQPRWVELMPDFQRMAMSLRVSANAGTEAS